MRRRSFLLAAAGAVWSLLFARAQDSMPVVGYVHVRSGMDKVSSLQAEAFLRGLQDFGFKQGRNLRVEFRWADGDPQRLPELVRELAEMRCAAIATAGGEQAVVAAKEAAPGTPIVFSMSSDPIKLGIADSYNRPGQNFTGINILTSALEPKRLDLLRQMVPQARIVGALINSIFPPSVRETDDLKTAAASAGIDLKLFPIKTESELPAAFDAMVHEGVGAIAVAGSPFFDTYRAKIIALANQHRIPAIYHLREYPAEGGMMSYGIDIAEVHHQLGRYVGRILRGARPADLPIMQPAKFEFIINARTVKEFGLTVPSGVLAIADEVLE